MSWNRIFYYEYFILSMKKLIEFKFNNIISVDNEVTSDSNIILTKKKCDIKN